MSITSFDRETVKNVRADMAAAMQEVAKKHGIKIQQAKSVRFDEHGFGLRFEVKTSEGDKAEETERKETVNQMAKMEGIDKPVFGVKFSLFDKTFSVIDYKPRNRKYPFIAKGDDGKQYKLSADHVRLGINSNDPSASGSGVGA